jgi:hypothetical protein
MEDVTRVANEIAKQVEHHTFMHILPHYNLGMNEEGLLVWAQVLDLMQARLLVEGHIVTRNND